MWIAYQYHRHSVVTVDGANVMMTGMNSCFLTAVTTSLGICSKQTVTGQVLLVPVLVTRHEFKTLLFSRKRVGSASE